MKQMGKLTLPATVQRIIDGDTISVQLRLDLDIRLLDCWAEELRDKDAAKRELALAAKRRLYSLLFTEIDANQWPVGKEIIVEVPFSSNLASMFTFGRVLGNIMLNGVNIGALLVEEGLAKTKKEGK
jgi:endonuclease YncB( thermonuclease family)